MARIRTIKPEFFRNEELAALSYEWRLLFIGLWTEADRAGLLEDRPLRLKATLFPYDDLDIDQGLGCLANAGLITRYERGGLRLLSITTWAKHQKPHEREAQSLYAPPDTAMIIESSAKALSSPTGREGKGTDRGREGVPAGVLERFEAFWAEYPRKVAKDAARKEFERLAPNAELSARLIAAVRAQRHSPQWVKDGGQFVPHARTWLHQCRWEDETRPRLTNATEAAWICPHVDRCGGVRKCADLLLLDAAHVAAGHERRWPLKPDVRYALDAHGVPREASS